VPVRTVDAESLSKIAVHNFEKSRKIDGGLVIKIHENGIGDIDSSTTFISPSTKFSNGKWTHTVLL